MYILVLQSSWWGRESWLLCLICQPVVLWWLGGSSSRCIRVVCGLWLRYFLIILTYYFWPFYPAKHVRVCIRSNLHDVLQDFSFNLICNTQKIVLTFWSFLKPAIGFRLEFFFSCFPYISLCKTCDPWLEHIFDLRHNLNKLSGVLLGDATYQISELCSGPCGFRQEDFSMISLYKPMKNMWPLGWGHLKPQEQF